MSALEEIRLAIARLEMARDASTPGPWLRDGVDVFYEAGLATILTPVDAYPRGDNAPEENAELVVILHRTIAAQLAVLEVAVAYGDLGEGEGSRFILAATTLARAINEVPA